MIQKEIQLKERKGNIEILSSKLKDMKNTNKKLHDEYNQALKELQEYREQAIARVKDRNGKYFQAMNPKSSSSTENSKSKETLMKGSYQQLKLQLI